MSNRISDSIDKHKVSVGVFIDLSKVFDTLNHERQFSKLENYAFRGLALYYLKDYLHNRRQYVVLMVVHLILKVLVAESLKAQS